MILYSQTVKQYHSAKKMRAITHLTKIQNKETYIFRDTRLMKNNSGIITTQ